MSNTVTLMKIFGFVGIVSALLIVLAVDENFKELSVYRTNWDHIQEQLGSTPFQEQPDVSQPETNYSATEQHWCLIQEFCPDIPLWSDFADSVIDTGSAIMAWARTFASFVGQIFSVLGWIADMVWNFITILVFVITFTIPGIPIYAQVVLWGINFSMWVAVVYISFTSITGAISGALPL